MLNNLPHNIEAEKSTLGAMISLREALIEGSSQLEEDDFYDPRHRIIFKAILAIQDKSIELDVQTLTSELLNMKDLENVGGMQYILEIMESNITPSNHKNYIEIVKEQSVLRHYLLQLKQVLEDYDKEEINDVSQFIGLTAESIMKKAEKRRISDFATAAEYASRVEKDLQTAKVTDEDGVTGLTTGYHQLNKITHGWQPGDVIILAARPSVGKTALALNFCINAAMKTKKPIGIFSLEMPGEQLITRLIACRSTIPLSKIQTSSMAQKEYLAVLKAIEEISATKIFIDDSPNIMLMDILSKARKLKMENPDLALIMIDYIGLITTGAKKVENRQIEVSNISRSLKALARELKVPVLLLSQVSRGVDARNDKRPLLSDLRESGSIEQDADLVMLLSRNDYQARKSNNYEKTQDIQQPNISENGETNNEVTLDVAKNRNGRIGEVKLIFTKEIGRFDEPAYANEEEE